MPVAQPPKTIGPLDADTLRPARTLAMLRVGALGALSVLVVVIAVLLAPMMSAGLGLSDQVSATVTAVDAGTTDSGQTCQEQHLTVAWSGGHTASVQVCERADATTDVGDTVAVWALPGWDRTMTGSRAPQTVFAIVMLAMLFAAAWGAVRSVWQWRALAAVRRGSTGALAGGANVIGIAPARMGQGQLRLRFSDDTYDDRELAIPGELPRSILNASVQVYALRQTRDGRPASPYVLRRTGPVSGTMVGFGRALRPSVHDS